VFSNLLGVVLTVGRFATMVYTEEGKVIIQDLWEETMKELEFAGVAQILEKLRKGRD